MTDTIRCLICDEPTIDDEGWPLGLVLAYQRVDGKIQLARELTLGKPMFMVHEPCIKALHATLLGT